MVDGYARLHLQPAGSVDADPRRGSDTGREADRRGRGAAPSAGVARSDPDADFACMFGIPDTELTPRVRRALTRLLARFDEARRQADTGREREAYLRGLADGDAVLPVGNRRYLIRELSRIIERSRIAQTTNTFVLISLANGADVRAVHGEAAAHALMCSAAGHLVSGVRASDAVATLGSYDFGIVLALASGDAAAAKACDLAETLAARPVEYAGMTLRAEVTWGLCEIGQDDAPDGVIAAADRDLLARRRRARR